MSFFVMPLAQTWLTGIGFRAPDTIVFTSHDHIHVPSRLPIPSWSRDGEGRPYIVESNGRFKMVYIGFSNGFY